MSERLTPEQRAQLQQLLRSSDEHFVKSVLQALDDLETLENRLVVSAAEVEMYRSAMQGLTLGDLLSAQKTKAECDSLRVKLDEWRKLGADTPHALTLIMELGLGNFKKSQDENAALRAQLEDFKEELRKEKRESGDLRARCEQLEVALNAKEEIK